jgi:uncharacterized protein DUF4397
MMAMESAMTVRMKQATRSVLLLALALAGCGGNETPPPGDLATADLSPPPPPPDLAAADLSPPPPPPDLAMTTPAPDLAQPSSPADTAPAATAHLRIVQGAPVGGPFDIYVQGSTTPLFSAVGFGGVTAYADLPAAATVLELRTAGDAATATPKLVSDPIALAADQRVSALALGLTGGSDATSKLRIAPLVEGFSAPGAGKARLRFVQGSYAAGAATATLGFDLGDDGSVELMLGRFADSAAEGVEVTAGKALPLALVSSAGVRQTSFTLPASLLGEGATAWVVLAGNNLMPHDAGAFTAIVAGTTGAASAMVRQDPKLFVLVAAADLPAPIDLFLGDRKVVTNRALPTAAGALTALQLPPGSGQSLTAFPTSASTTPPATGALGSFATGALEAGERYLAVLSGLSTTPPAGRELQLHLYRDDFAPPASDMFGRIRVLDAVADVAGTVDVGRWVTNAWVEVLDGGNLPFAGLAFGGSSPASGTPIVDAGAQSPLNPAVRAGGTTTPVKHATVGTQMATDRFFGIPAGALVPATGQVPLRFIVVTAPRESLGAMAVKSSPLMQ